MKSYLACTLLGFSLLSCQSPGSDTSPQVRDGLLAYVPESQQTEVNHARRRCTEMREQRSAAARDTAESESHCALARQNVSRLEIRVAEARGQSKHARSYGSNTEFEEAQTTRNDTEAALRLGNSKSAYYEVLSDLAERRETLLEERTALANARFELAKARAVSTLDRPVANKIDVDDHRHAVRLAADRVERARIEALVARERARLWKTYVAERVELVPQSLRLGRIEPMDSLFKADAYEDAKDKLGIDEMAPARKHKNGGTDA